MSLFNSGADCSSSRNPLAQFSKLNTQDRTLQNERFGSPASAATSMRAAAANQAMTAADRQMMDKFMAGDPQAQAQSQAFSFDQMRHELGGLQNQPRGAQGWATDFAGQKQAGVPPLMGEVRHASPGVANGRWGAEFNAAPQQQQQQPRSNMYSGMSYMPQMSMMSSGSMAPQQSSRIVELENENWEQHFRQIEESAQTASKGKSVTQDAAMQDEDIRTNESELFEDKSFDEAWANIKNEIFNGNHDWTAEDRTAAWDRDFAQFTKARPAYGEYQFEENNKFMDQPDPFAIGVHIMESGGNLSEAALAFEAAVQKNPAHAEAWSRLGAVQAQNEKEDSAVRALERCIDLDPTDLTALMNLAVSYTNESYENAAYSTLEKWIATKYPEIVSQARKDDPKIGNADYVLHSRVTELFIRAAQLSPDGVNIDASVQDGLGVLFYGNEEFEKAIDCFNAALAVRPTDPLLWNRLGATLANSNRSEEAIEAYSKALELRPSFVRARYNLGVSCVNIGCYHEAAQHLLSALSMTMDHTGGGSSAQVPANQSNNLLSTLKRIFLAMNRADLADKVHGGMDINSFRSDFEF